MTKDGRVQILRDFMEEFPDYELEGLLESKRERLAQTFDRDYTDHLDSLMESESPDSRYRLAWEILRERSGVPTAPVTRSKNEAPSRSPSRH